MSEKKKMKIGVVLEGDTVDKFNDIQKAKGIKNRGEIIRMMIHEYHLTLAENGEM